MPWKNKSQVYEYNGSGGMKFVSVCMCLRRKWHEIYFCVHEICMHVHAAECSGMKFISVCMQVRRNAAKCKSFMCVCERGENDKILMNAYFMSSAT